MSCQMLTQNERLLAYFKRRRRVTMRDIFDDLDINNPWARISELRQPPPYNGLLRDHEGRRSHQGLSADRRTEARGVINHEAHDADAELERRIDQQVTLLSDPLRTEGEKLSAWDELRRLHAQRSPERIEQMERERGLR